MSLMFWLGREGDRLGGYSAYETAQRELGGYSLYEAAYRALPEAVGYLDEAPCQDTWAKLAIAYGYESDGFITVHPKV